MIVKYLNGRNKIVLVRVEIDKVEDKSKFDFSRECLFFLDRESFNSSSPLEVNKFPLFGDLFGFVSLRCQFEKAF